MNNEQVINTVAWLPLDNNAPKNIDIVVYAPPYDGLPAMASMCRWHESSGFCIDELRSPTHYLMPPKMKPAYRVWKYTNDRLTYVQDRFEDGTVNAIGKPQDIQIIQDWTEYDPEPKQWPTPLVERIAVIDIKAADWIVEHWDDLLEDRYSRKYYSREANCLELMFEWSATPQKSNYWENISRKLGE